MANLLFRGLGVHGLAFAVVAFFLGEVLVATLGGCATLGFGEHLGERYEGECGILGKVLRSNLIANVDC
jgi:hypothetical protein